MTETSPEKDGKSKALPKALVKDEEEGVASAAGEDEQPEPRKYKWLAVFLMSVALVSISANAGLTTALVTKAFGTHTQEHVYAVALTSRLDSAGASVVAEVPCVKVLEAIASTKNGDRDPVMTPLGNGEFSTPAISAAHYHVHKDSFGMEQIFLSAIARCRTTCRARPRWRLARPSTPASFATLCPRRSPPRAVGLYLPAPPTWNCTWNRRLA